MEKRELAFVALAIFSTLSLLVTSNHASAEISAPSPIPGPQLPPTTGSSTSPPSSTPPQTVPISPTTNYEINQVKSGYVVSDSLTNETRTQQQLASNSGYWTYGGDAPLFNAQYDFFRNATGLYIGVNAPANGSWAGYYAVTRNTTAMLFHAVVSTPLHTIPSNNNWFENGIYVQNGTGNVSYIVCNAITSSIGTQWVVSLANGNSQGATTFTNLWWSPMDQNQPLTRDCTIITNGHNYLKVYLNGTKVFESHSMHMNYINPMVAFLEPQSSFDGQLLNGSYKDFYATTSDNVTITNNPSGASTVDIVQPTSACYGTVLATGTVDSSGTASVEIGQYHMPLSAYIQTYDSSGHELASTTGQVSIFGGDVYSANQVSPTNIATSTSNTAQCTGTVPTGLAATAVSTSQINLSWNAPSGNSELPTGYKIERSTDGGTTWSTVVADTGSQATTYSDMQLQPSTTYTYRVSAIYLSSTSQPSNAASATTQCATCQLTVTGQNSTTTSIQGLYTTLVHDGTTVASGFTPATFSLQNGIAYNITLFNYPPNAFSHWTDTGSASNPRAISITNSTQITGWFVNGSPQPPTGLVASGVSTTQINLSWTAPSNTGSSPLTGYKVERSADNGTSWATIVSRTNSTSTSYSDTGLEASTSYTYRVSAVNSYGTSQPSGSASARTLAATAPQPPTNLAAAPGNSQVSLSWTAPSSNGGSAITGYDIYRGTTAGGEGATPVGAVNGSTLSYTDTGLANGQAYYYMVSAVNSAGTSPRSNEASATPVTAPQPPTGLTAAPGNSNITLSWTAPSSNGGSAITGYDVYRGTTSGGEGPTPVASGITATSYTDTGLANGQAYYFTVSASNSAGTSGQSNEASATPTAPSSIVLTNVKSTSANANQIQISNFNAGTGSNRVLIVGVSASKQYVSSISYGGVMLKDAVSSFTNNDAEFWYLANPSGTGNIVVKMSGGTPAVVGAYAFSGVDQTDPIPTTAATHNTADSSPAVSITTKDQNSWVLDLPSIYGGKTLGSPTCTEQWDINMPNAITGASSSQIAASPGAVSCGWAASGGGDLWDDVAVEIKASG